MNAERRSPIWPAHGHHSQESFLFSRLDLTDGPLMVYDMGGQAQARAVSS